MKRRFWRMFAARSLGFLCRFAGALALCCLAAQPGLAAERILEMNVSAVVHPDSRLSVTEEIAFVAEGRDIRHGLIRVFPVEYRERGRRVRVGLNVDGVTLDGKPVIYRTERVGRNAEIIIGDPGRQIPPGRHTFVLTYTTTDQIRFFDDHDELYWNVTGNDWPFPIEEASFRVTLPDGAAYGDFVAYTGPYRGKGKDFTRSGNGVFRTTRTLLPRECLTVAVGWPKGVVTPPPLSFWDKYWAYIAGFLLSAAGAWYLYAWRRWVRRPKRGVIIPLFSPPDGMMPGDVRFVRELRYDSVSLGADIIHLAVSGHLTIHDLGGGEYVLRARAGEPKQGGGLRVLWGGLFSDERREFRISEKDEISSIALCRLTGKMRIIAWFQRKRYYRRRIKQWFVGLLPLIIALMSPGLAVKTAPSTLVAIVFKLVVVAFAVLAFFLMGGRTELGHSLMDKIEGLVMYLVTAETHRLEALYPSVKGKVPPRTPEVFDRFLPYALALDTAVTWADNFADVLLPSRETTWLVSSDPAGSVSRLVSGDFNCGIRDSVSAGMPESSGSSSSSGSSGFDDGFAGGGGGGGGGRGW